MNVLPPFGFAHLVGGWARGHPGHGPASDCLACLVALFRDLQEPVLRSDPGPPGFILAQTLRGGVLKS